MTSGRSLVGGFLRARRELLQPEDVGLARDANRRVRGLRREEVAALAGISHDYYLRLEQGRDHQPSDQVLRALSRALRLDAHAGAYLHRLAHRVATDAPRPAAVEQGLLHLIEQWTTTPAFVSDSNHDVLAINRAAAEATPWRLEVGTNLLLARFESGPDGAEDLATGEWEALVERMVASLRYHGDPDDPRLQHIVGTLSVAHRSFRRLWARHDAHPQSSGAVRLGDATTAPTMLRWQTFEVPGARGQFVTTLFTEDAGRAAMLSA